MGVEPSVVYQMPAPGVALEMVTETFPEDVPLAGDIAGVATVCASAGESNRGRTQNSFLTGSHISHRRIRKWPIGSRRGAARDDLGLLEDIEYSYCAVQAVRDSSRP